MSGPAHGTLSNPGAGQPTYTPDPGYSGSDSFTFKANDGQADSNVATVTLTISPVNDPPVAADDSYTTDQDVALTVAAPGVLVNDTDECHNFHIHQAHFRVREIALVDGQKGNACLGDLKAAQSFKTQHDNFPLPPGSRIVVDIPFTRPQQIGKFAYHCHILGHEDKGMMATVEVVP